MSDVAAASPKPTRRITAAQPSAGLPQAAPSAPAPAPAKPVQTLREAQPKKFPPSGMWPLGQDYDILAVTVPAEWTFEEVMKPIAWANVAPRVAKDPLNTRRECIGSLIYAHSPHFSAWLRIISIQRDHMNNPCGLNVVCIGPSVDVKTGEARPIDVKTGKAWFDPVKTEG